MTNLRLAERGFFPTIGGDTDVWGEKLDSTYEEIERVLPVFADAFGDGLSTTDSAQNDLTIQAAIDYQNAQGGGPVLIHQGTWPLERSAPGQAWGVQNKSGVTIRGCGRGVTTLKLADAQVDFIRPISFAPGAANAQVMDLTIDGNKANQTSTFEHQAGIYVNYGTDALIERVEVKDTVGDCINWGTSDPAFRAVRPVIRDVWLHGPMREGIHAQYYTHGLIEGAHIWGLTGESCIKGEIDNELGAVGAEGITIANCVFEGDGTSGTNGVLLSGASLTTPIRDVVVKGCQFYDLDGQAAVSIGIASHGWVVEGNLFERCEAAVRMSSYSPVNYGYVGHIGVSVTGNVVRNATVADAALGQIDLANATDVTVTGNSVEGAGILLGYRFQHCKILAMSGNSVQGDSTCVGAFIYRSQNVNLSGFTAHVPAGTGVKISDDGTYPNAAVYVGNVTVTGPCAIGVDVAGATTGIIALGTVFAPGATTNIVANYSTAKGSTDFRVRVPTIATANLPTAAANRDGTLIIEDAGAGDRNLIVYTNAQRFRIDGGAAF